MRGGRGVSDSGVCNRVIDLPGCWVFWRVTAYKPRVSCKDIWGKKSSAPRSDNLDLNYIHNCFALECLWILRLEHPDSPEQ